MAAPTQLDVQRHVGEMSAKDQRAWAASLLARLTSPGLDAPAVCLLDTGVNHRHPLLAPAIADVIAFPLERA